ncbi:5-bromo-4-chloroindolyl phosphate hydrolysis family protein [Bartonella sp. LJL80]
MKRGIIKRLFIHAASLFAAVWIYVELYGASSDKDELVIASYVGLICIFGRHMSNRFGGFFPTLCGIIQVLVAYLLGAPLPYALLLGGLVAWVAMFYGRRIMHCYVRHKIAKTEWFALLMVAFYLPYQAIPDTIWAYLSIIPVGWISIRFSTGIAIKRALISINGSVTATLNVISSFRRKEFEKISSIYKEIVDYVSALIKSGIKRGKSGPFFAVAYRLADMTKEAETLSAITAAEDFDLAVNKLLSQSIIVREYLKLANNNENTQPLDQPESKNAGRQFDEKPFRKDVLALSKIAKRLPDSYANVFRSIGRSADNIINCIDTDPNDVLRGTRFLKRYLPIAINIGEKHLAFLANKPSAQVVQDVDQSNLKILMRLDNAFSAEHANLLKNDVMDINVDINTLDRLLKIDGFD